MLGLSAGYVIVGPPNTVSRWSWLPWVERDLPVITREDPDNCITEHDPLRPTRVVAGLKRYRDDVAGKDVAYLYLPGYVFRASKDCASSGGLAGGPPIPAFKSSPGPIS